MMSNRTDGVCVRARGGKHSISSLTVFGFANTHYAGYAPSTVELFWDLWREGE